MDLHPAGGSSFTQLFGSSVLAPHADGPHEPWFLEKRPSVLARQDLAAGQRHGFPTPTIESPMANISKANRLPDWELGPAAEAGGVGGRGYKKRS